MSALYVDVSGVPEPCVSGVPEPYVGLVGHPVCRHPEAGWVTCHMAGVSARRAVSGAKSCHLARVVPGLGVWAEPGSFVGPRWSWWACGVVGSRNQLALAPSGRAYADRRVEQPRGPVCSGASACVPGSQRPLTAWASAASGPESVQLVRASGTCSGVRLSRASRSARTAPPGASHPWSRSRPRPCCRNR